MPDWLDALIKIITFVLAGYGVMSAFAAKRSALAAEQQAIAATRQAELAEMQARAAERQVDIMTKMMNIDHVAVAIAAKRTAQDIKDATAALIRAGRAPVAAVPPVHVAGKTLQELEKKLLDLPPVFPGTNVRTLAMHYISEIDRSRTLMATGKFDDNAVAMLDLDADRLIAAMDADIGRQISALELNA